MQGYLLVDSYKSTGGGPVHSPAAVTIPLQQHRLDDLAEAMKALDGKKCIATQQTKSQHTKQQTKQKPNQTTSTKNTASIVTGDPVQ
jgi:hypothetical protein